MCFSANASFAAGIALTVIGIATVRKAKQPNQIAFASIPIIFAVQQFSEGILWLALTHPEYRFLKEEATYTFLFFAQVIWPIWVPWAIMILEKKEQRKRIQKIMLTISLTVTIYLLFCLFIFDVDARIGSNHIHYALDYPASIGKFGAMLYIFVTISPPYFSRVKGMWILATIILISYIITFIFYRDYLLSVWCFFSALISVVIYYIISKIPKKEVLK
ncbi:MAG: hypothetical protein IPO32_14400 [Crocinitomicaceae bacterium]|nr:hypothetical protein [Crocinitomicaceae bacterium]